MYLRRRGKATHTVDNDSDFAEQENICFDDAVLQCRDYCRLSNDGAYSLELDTCSQEKSFLSSKKVDIL